MLGDGLYGVERAFEPPDRNGTGLQVDVGELESADLGSSEAVSICEQNHCPIPRGSFPCGFEQGQSFLGRQNDHSTALNTDRPTFPNRDRDYSWICHGILPWVLGIRGAEWFNFGGIRVAVIVSYRVS